MSYTTNIISEFLPKQNELKKLEKDLEDIKNCPHENTGYYCLIQSNGKNLFMELCTLCGERKDKTKTWLKHDSIPLDAVITEYTQGVKKEFSNKKNYLENEIRKIKYALEMSDKYQEYEKYLLSPEWEEKRRIRMIFNENNFNGKCEICFKNKATQCHHMSYQRLYNEWIFDLAAVCSDCHRRIHKINE